MKDDAGTVRLLETEWGAVPVTVLPTSDNSLDLGSAAKSWRTIYIDTSIVLGAAASKIVPGATSFAIRNNADSADNLIITDAGAATIRTSLAVTTSATIGSDLTVDTSTLKVDSSNNRVGIGTASPQAKLHVVETNSNFSLIRMTNSANGTGLKNWEMINWDDGRFEIRSLNDAWDSVNATALVLENTTGYVGMGTTSPVGKIHVADTDAGMFFWRTSGLTSTPVSVITGISYYAHIIGAIRNSSGSTVYGFDCTLTLNTLYDLSDSQPFDGTKSPYAALSAGGVLSVYLDASLATGWSLAMQVIYS